ncbi:MAG: asparagine--tRNA ligase [Chlamydiota bacterium]
MLLKRSVKQLLTEQEGMQGPCTLTGWVRSVRVQKNFCFLQVNDGTYFDSIQVILDKTLPNYPILLEDLSTGASVEIEGSLVKSPGGKQEVELQATRLLILGTCPNDYPLQKKRHSFPYLRTIAHLRPRTNTQGACLRVRSLMSYAVHHFFHEKGFVHVHTPIITNLDCEGAGELFRVTRGEENFFGPQSYLNVSGQLEAEICALALSQVYTFGPTFRAENSHTSRHLSEFWMIEPEMAFCRLDRNMDIAEEFLKFLIRFGLEKGTRDLDFFAQFIEKGLIEKLSKFLEIPFPRLSYTEAIEVLKKAPNSFSFPVEWGCDLQAEHERYLAEEFCKGPVFLYNYPKEIKAFYMKESPDGKTVRAVDLLVPGIGELIGGSEREDDLEILKSKICAQGLSPEQYWWYLDLRKYGSCPHSGFGMGFERLLQVMTGMENIRDVIPFPRYPGHAEF